MGKKGLKRLGAFILAVIMFCTPTGMMAFADTDSADGGQDSVIYIETENPPDLLLNTYLSGRGYGQEMTGGLPSGLVAGSWVTAMKASLDSEYEDLSVRYQVNLSGSGWLDWAKDGEETGGAGGEMPLEAIRMELLGEQAGRYDIYYKVFQNGVWTEWAMNGETSGTEAMGLRVDGIRALIAYKGQGIPQSPRAKIDPSKPMIALTYDDGPSSVYTNRILDVLEMYGAGATFFMVGSRVASNASVIQRMVRLGCEPANHTYNHKYLSKIGADEALSQMALTSQAIAAVCGVTPTLLRPPGGYIDASSLELVGSLGMSAIMWSIDTLDWKHRNAQTTIDTVLSQVKDGDIILMHDIHEATAEAAVYLIPELVARGYQLVTVSELAQARGGLVAGVKYSQFR